jgi:hypothetical protein
VYYGKADQTVDYFARKGFKMPAYNNPGDFFLQVISTQFKNPTDPTSRNNLIYTDKKF